MGEFFYSIFLGLYATGIRIAALFNRKAALFVNGRKGLLDTIQTINPTHTPLLWMHCASLGEFEQGRPVLEMFAKTYPDHKIALSFFSPSGYEVHKNYPLADRVLYLPLDSATHAKKWCDALQPTLAFFIKYEFWHYYLKELHHRECPVLSISSIFRPSQSYFKVYGGFNRKTLAHITHFFVQDNDSQVLLNEIGFNNITITGDTRFDRVFDLSRDVPANTVVDQFVSDAIEVFIVGSAWPEDMEVLYPLINSEKIKFIIAPHEISDRFINDMTSRITRPVARYSNFSNADVLIIDNIGLLASLYHYGKFAWIGGAFGKGLHNVLEAAVYGIPVFFGNRNYKKFREARMLEQRGGGFSIESSEELSRVFRKLQHPEEYRKVKVVNTEIVQENLGATEKIMSYCHKLLKK